MALPSALATTSGGLSSVTAVMSWLSLCQEVGEVQDIHFNASINKALLQVGQTGRSSLRSRTWGAG